MKLTKIQLKKLGEIADIGAKSASKYLSTMTNKKFSVNIPWVSMYPYEKIPRTVGNPAETVTAVFMQVQGELEGVILMIFPEKSALQMAGLLQGEEVTKLDDMADSALKEAGGNILANAYLNAFADKLKLKITDSIPHITTDMLDAVMGGVLSQFAAKTQDALVFKNSFQVGKEKVEGHAFILFDPDSFELIIKKLKNAR